MNFNRREFLGSLLGAHVSMMKGWRPGLLNAQTSTGTPQCRLTNHQEGGRALVKEGKTLLVTLSFSKAAASLAGEFPVPLEPEMAGGAQLLEPQPLSFYMAQDGLIWRTILSAPLDAVEGTSSLRLSVSFSGGKAQQLSFPYAVERSFYRQSVLTLDENFSAPSPAVAARRQLDFETMVEIYRRRTSRRWHAPFMRPVTGPDRSNFGDKRVVNGTKRYRHSGLDYRAATGTPVRAINDATVALSAEQWTPGQTICLDHGGGIFSKYLHLSKRLVSEGDTVTRGQVIALSGHSGGQKPPPHLHMDMVVNGTHVDPQDFMNTAAQLLALEGAERLRGAIR